MVGSAAYLNLSLGSCRLTLLVKGHNHQRSTKVLYNFRAFNKNFLTLLKRKRVYNRLALYCLQRRYNHLKARRVNHPRHTRNLWLRCHNIQKLNHLRLCIYHRIVHIYIKHHSAIINLLASDSKRLGVVFLADKSQKFTTSRNVAPLANIDKSAIRLKSLKACKPCALASFRLSWVDIFHSLGNRCDMFRG